MALVPEVVYGTRSAAATEVGIVRGVFNKDMESRPYYHMEFSAVRSDRNSMFEIIENIPRVGFKYLNSRGAYCEFLHPDGFVFNISNSYASKLLYLENFQNTELQLCFNDNGTFAGLISAEEAKTLPDRGIKDVAELPAMLAKGLEVGATIRACRSKEVFKYLGSKAIRNTLYHVLIGSDRRVHLYNTETDEVNNLESAMDSIPGNYKRRLRTSALHKVQEMNKRPDHYVKTELEQKIAIGMAHRSLLQIASSKHQVASVEAMAAILKADLEKMSQLSSFAIAIVLEAGSVFHLDLCWSKGRWLVSKSKGSTVSFNRKLRAAEANLPFNADIDEGVAEVRTADELIDLLVAFSDNAGYIHAPIVEGVVHPFFFS